MQQFPISTTTEAFCDNDVTMVEPFASDTSCMKHSDCDSPSSTDAGQISPANSVESVCTTNSIVLEEPKPFLMIWDWDDTLLPSNWCNRKRLSIEYGEVTDEVICKELHRVCKQAEESLNLCKSLGGEIVIVTNAEEGWIDLSCKAFFPSLVPYIENCRHVSARTKYEKKVGQNPVEWKSLTFKVEIDTFMQTRKEYEQATGIKISKRAQIISFGDSNHEREALAITTKDMKTDLVHAKSVKFLVKPTIDQLVREHELIRQSLKQLLSHETSLDLVVRVENTQ